MFQQTFVDGSAESKKPLTLALSTLLQMAAMALLILLPLLYTQVLPVAQLKSLLLAPPPPIAPVKPMVVEKKSSQSLAVRLSRLGALAAPRAIPQKVVQVDESGPPPDLLTGAAGNAPSSAPDPLLYGSTAGPPAPVPAETPKPHVANGPVRIGGVVAEANVLHRVQPVYPPLAQSARVQGAVEFTAIISKEGRVEHLQLVSGHPLLVNAAREAILQWVYRPTLLNGRPVEVMTTIVVNFTMTN